ncbi:MAG: hypothetical protein LBF88_06430 [Planctomycetaceae bacterium]|jgi:hypothetical protein|nr:hypothetical protein [Planctomycetaceae bacterium]
MFENKLSLEFTRTEKLFFLVIAGILADLFLFAVLMDIPQLNSIKTISQLFLAF